MTTQIEKWQNKLENIENTTHEYRDQLMKEAKSWPTCAIGALLCDIIGATPDTIDVKVEQGQTDQSRGHKFRNALWSRDRCLYNLGLSFYFSLRHKEYHRTKKILVEIKAYKPNNGLLSRISKRKDA